MKSRLLKPDGVSTLGILAGITGFLLLGAGSALASGVGTSTDGPEAFGIVISLLLGYFGPLAATQQITPSGELLLVLAFVYFITAIGLFRGKPWAWTLSIILSVLAISLNLFQIAVLSSPTGQTLGWPLVFCLPALFAALAILFYLTRPRVIRFFRQ